MKKFWNRIDKIVTYLHNATFGLLILVSLFYLILLTTLALLGLLQYLGIY